MPDLGGFSERGQNRRAAPSQGLQSRAAEQTTSVQRQPKGPPSRDRCPAGWDADIWHLVLLFEQYARADEIELTAGRPVIYMEINDLVSRYGMRPQVFRQEVHGCERRKLGTDMAAHCWYHWPPGKPAEQEARELTWVQKAEIILAEFWSRIQNEHAADHLRQYFAEYGQACLAHWRSLRIAKAIDEQPREPRQIMRRVTMPADSEEG